MVLGFLARKIIPVVWCGFGVSVGLTFWTTVAPPLRSIRVAPIEKLATEGPQGRKTPRQTTRNSRSSGRHVQRKRRQQAWRQRQRRRRSGRGWKLRRQSYNRCCRRRRSYIRGLRAFRHRVRSAGPRRPVRERSTVLQYGWLNRLSRDLVGLSLVAAVNWAAGGEAKLTLAVGLVFLFREVVLVVGLGWGILEVLRCVPVLDRAARVGTFGALLCILVGTVAGSWGHP